jgi:hypothetical protein
MSLRYFYIFRKENKMNLRDTYRIIIRFLAVLFMVSFIMSYAYSQAETGDVDGNGTITIIDALLVAQYYVGLNPPGLLYIDASDVDCDGGTDIIDALLIAQYYVNLISEFPACDPTPQPQPADWETTTGGSGTDIAKAIILSRDNGYIIAGYSDSTDIPGCINNGSSDVYLVKIDENREIVWQKMFGGPDSDMFQSITLTPEDGYVTAGDNITRYDENGNILWENNAASGYAYSIQAVPGNGYIATGYTTAWEEIQPSPAPNQTPIPTTAPQVRSVNCFVTKMEEGGTIEWQKILRTPYDEYGFAVAATPDEGYVIAGYKCDNQDPLYPPDFYVVKLNPAGDLVWEITLGGSGSDVARAVHVTDDNSYIIAGYSDSTDIPGCVNNGNQDMYVVKLDTDGNIVWQRLIGGEYAERVYSIQRTDDNNYLIAGNSNSSNIPGCINQGYDDCYVIHLNNAGDVLSQYMFGTTGNEDIFSIQITSAYSYIVAGSTTDYSDTQENFYISEKSY